MHSAHQRFLRNDTALYKCSLIITVIIIIIMCHPRCSSLAAFVDRVHMHDLKDVTNNVHYENFRYSHLATVTSETTGGPAAAGQKTKPVTTSKYVASLSVTCLQFLYCCASSYFLH